MYSYADIVTTATAKNSIMAQANALQHRGGLDFFALARHSNQFLYFYENSHIISFLEDEL